MKNKFFAILTLLALSTTILHAEKLATVLRGKIIANNLSDIQVIIKESDGSILDITDISSAGIYSLDLTIMDTPSLAEVNKLIIEVKSKSGNKKFVRVSKYLSVFADTVLLKPIVLP